MNALLHAHRLSHTRPQMHLHSWTSIRMKARQHKTLDIPFNFTKLSPSFNWSSNRSPLRHLLQHGALVSQIISVNIWSLKKAPLLYYSTFPQVFLWVDICRHAHYIDSIDCCKSVLMFFFLERFRALVWTMALKAKNKLLAVRKWLSHFTLLGRWWQRKHFISLSCVCFLFFTLQFWHP